MADFKSRDLRNAKNGGLVSTKCSDLEAATTFAEAFQDQDHWLWYWIHKTVQELPARDADDALDYICDWFLVAVGHGLKRPMIRVHFRDQRFKLYLSEKGTLCLKTGSLEGEDDEKSDEPTSYDPTGRERYIGCFLRGQFRVARERIANYGAAPEYSSYRRSRRYSAPVTYTDGADYKPNPTETEFLSRLKADPVGFLAECGRAMDRCCYCNLPLEDERSKKVGYGPICAKHWSLPWGATKEGTNTVKAFSEVYNRDCHYLCVAVRLNIGDDHVWGVLNDWLAERSALPARKVKKGGDTRVLHKPEGRFRYPRWDGAAPQRPQPKPCPVPVPQPKYEDTPVGINPNSVPSDKLVWSSSIKTLSVKVSDLGWGEFPSTVTVKSAKTGATRTFVESCRDFKVSELQCVRYASPDGIKLVIHNS